MFRPQLRSAGYDATQSAMAWFPPQRAAAAQATAPQVPHMDQRVYGYQFAPAPAGASADVVGREANLLRTAVTDARAARRQAKAAAMQDVYARREGVEGIGPFVAGAYDPNLDPQDRKRRQAELKDKIHDAPGGRSSTNDSVDSISSRFRRSRAQPSSSGSPVGFSSSTRAITPPAS